MINRIKKFIKELDWIWAGICLLLCAPLSILVWNACDTDNPSDIDKFLFTLTGFVALVLFCLFGEKIRNWLYGDFK